MLVHSRHNFLLAAAIPILLALSVALSGCSETTAGPKDSAGSPQALPSDNQIRDMIDAELTYTYTKRSLNLTDHGAWQIMHAVLPFGTHLKVYHGTEPVAALQWVLDGHPMKGWTLRPGTEGLSGGRRGLRTIVEPGKVGQGHPEQWLAIMAASGLHSDQKILFDGHEYQIRDMVQQAMWDMYENKEASWDLAAIVTYLGPNAKWKSSDGQEWTVERLVSMEARQDLSTSACGGTHRLSALNKALQAHIAQAHLTDLGELDGGWLEAKEKLDGAIEAARRFQQPDGSLSNNFFVRPGWSPDPVAQMYSTGHTLEFLAMALSKEQLQQPWVKRAVVRLCTVFHQLRPVDVECGSLYHAASGLMKYRQKVYGQGWKYPDDKSTPSQQGQGVGQHPAPKTDHQVGFVQIR